MYLLNARDIYLVLYFFLADDNYQFMVSIVHHLRKDLKFNTKLSPLKKILKWLRNFPEIVQTRIWYLHFCKINFLLSGFILWIIQLGIFPVIRGCYLDGFFLTKKMFIISKGHINYGGPIGGATANDGSNSKTSRAMNTPPAKNAQLFTRFLY
ncbi:hypothetical protein DERF_009503 [Dermatophagoides farinae]|uniref:Uncharacterized protein n=1 Tax=Dermatophagoides farinae TaxID=6954 RepID=A0A922HX25_DERFA|nr:hypothetical protein DERF_009503 [Dermatophagoides farinae]